MSTGFRISRDSDLVRCRSLSRGRAFPQKILREKLSLGGGVRANQNRTAQRLSMFQIRRAAFPRSPGLRFKGATSYHSPRRSPSIPYQPSQTKRLKKPGTIPVVGHMMLQQRSISPWYRENAPARQPVVIQKEKKEL
jgi:hypothetical protein